MAAWRRGMRGSQPAAPCAAMVMRTGRLSILPSDPAQREAGREDRASHAPCAAAACEGDGNDERDQNDLHGHLPAARHSIPAPWRPAFSSGHVSVGCRPGRRRLSLAVIFHLPQGEKFLPHRLSAPRGIDYNPSGQFRPVKPAGEDGAGSVGPIGREIRRETGFSHGQSRKTSPDVRAPRCVKPAVP